jgi:hypothetical protein
MTESPDQGSAVPPYEGRQETGHVEGADEAQQGGANVGGATGPVEDERPKATAPEDTPRGATASPAEEIPAEQTPSGESEEASVGPAHHAGTTRGEDAD